MDPDDDPRAELRQAADDAIVRLGARVERMPAELVELYAVLGYHQAVTVALDELLTGIAPLLTSMASEGAKAGPLGIFKLFGALPTLLAR